MTKLTRSTSPAPKLTLAVDVNNGVTAEVRRAIAAVMDAGRALGVIGRCVENTAGETLANLPAGQLHAQAIALHAEAESALLLVTVVLDRSGQLAGLAAVRRLVEDHAEVSGDS